MNEIEFSIIIPLYNQEKYIKKCAESALNQSFGGNYEVIIINDGSKDNSRKILQDFQNSRLKIFDNENFGVSYSRNFGLKHALGNYIIFLDADDYIAFDTLENIYKTTKQNNFDVILTPFYALREERKDIKLYKPIKEYDEASGSLNIKNTKGKILKANLELCTKVYKKQFLTENCIEFPSYKTAEDLPFFYNVMMKANKIKVLDMPFYFYRKGHKASFKEEAVIDVINAARESGDIIKKYEDFEAIKKVYIENFIKVCLYWCKKFKKLNNRIIFYRFCLAEMKALRASLACFVKFYLRLFIINLIEI